MRGAPIALIAAGLALAGALVSASDAASVRYASARAAVGAVGDDSFGAAQSRREGKDKVDANVAEPGLTVGAGIARASTVEDGATGAASAVARDVDVLDGRVRAQRVTRSAERTAGGVTRDGEVVGLVVEGSRFGPIRKKRSFTLSGGERLVLNDGDTGLRVITDGDELRVAIADVTTFTRTAPTPTPTRTPKPDPTKTAKPDPTATRTPKRKEPPKVPPRLTAGGYAFPVVGEVEYEDTFGAPREFTGSHEGADIFAEFGAPIVAVRDGRLTKVGTLEISGNRLWVIADNGDAFFYAHLSSFATTARNGARVQAGDVLGFVGNTGDAEPTPPHLHFEVHPGGIGKDAVNPTPILRSWERREDVPPGAWVQRLGADAAERPGALVTVRDFIAE